MRCEERGPSRVLALVSLVLVATGLVAACGGGSTSVAEPGPTSGRVTTSTQVADPAEAAGVAQGGVLEALGSLDGIELLDGGTLDLASIVEGPVVVWFWAPWCPNCRAMAPDLADLAVEHAGAMSIVGVAGRGTVEEMRGFVADTGTDGLDHLVDAEGTLWAEFGVFSQPAFAFVARDGSVEVVMGRQTRQAMDARVGQLLGS